MAAPSTHTTQNRATSHPQHPVKDQSQLGQYYCSTGIALCYYSKMFRIFPALERRQGSALHTHHTNMETLATHTV